MDRNTYNEKMTKMIADGPYLSMGDPTQELSSSIHELVKLLLNSNKISKEESDHFIVKHSRSPIIYGAPKIHKENIPLRPVVDFRSSPTYNIAKSVSQILKKVAENHPFTVKNSLDFVKRIRNLQVRPGDVKVSFDVTSLFTKVPIPETTLIIQQGLEEYQDLASTTKLLPNEIMKLLKLCLSSTYFKFQNNYYGQIEGTAMGSPLSPIVAELFLQNMENEIIASDRSIYFWVRYVDDVYAILRRRSVNTVLNKINSYHQSIQFTMEEEQEGELPFLDVMIYEKPNRTFGHKLYKKPTHTNKYLHYESYHPQAHKLGVIDTLFTRAIKLSDNENKEKEIEDTIRILKQNGYPSQIIKKRLSIVENKIQTNFVRPQSIDKRIILPWGGNVTNKIARYLRNNLKVELGFIPGPKLSRILCNAKENPQLPKCGIYSINCKTCSSKYIGETGRDFLTRASEHLVAIRRNAVLRSPVALHMSENDHEVDLQSIKLIEKEPRKYFRKFKEALYIRQTVDKMNISRGLPINPIWCSTLITFLNYSP
jgi:hypothetical protein